MKFVEEAILNILKNDAAITAKVGDRIHVNTIPQGADFPAIRVVRIATEGNETKDGPSTVDNVFLQIDSFSDHTLEAKEVAELIREALDYYNGIEPTSLVNIINMTYNNATMVRYEEVDVNAIASEYIARVAVNES